MRVLALPGPLFLFPWVPRPFPCPHQTPALQQQRTTSAPPTPAPRALRGAACSRGPRGGILGQTKVREATEVWKCLWGAHGYNYTEGRK